MFRLMPEAASTFASKFDVLFFVLLALLFIFTGTVALIILILGFRYRRGSKADRSNPPEGHIGLELIWSVGPLILGLGVFLWGAILFAQVRQPPANAAEVFVIAKRWMWHFEHTNGIREMDKLHVPLGQPVKLTMISQDVIHSFFCPEFRLHQDVIPGVYTTTWFQATKVGRYHLFCSQYCGTQHSEMTGWIYVMSPSDYQRWVGAGGPADDEQNVPSSAAHTMEGQGEQIFQDKACNNCHTAEDTVRAPTLVGIFGKARKMQDGRLIQADNAYLRSAILDPESNALQGYPQTMPSYKELTEEQVLQLITYIKSLGPASAQASGTPAATGATSARSAGRTVRGAR
ncbi:MAG TPA: cytochrome c oxidase subunit II [Chthonomonadales bacterium]|nr:cytochrome c oxidase subunit II [Chthonomonadales bacterium]